MQKESSPNIIEFKKWLESMPLTMRIHIVDKLLDSITKEQNETAGTPFIDITNNEQNADIHQIENDDEESQVVDANQNKEKIGLLALEKELKEWERKSQVENEHLQKQLNENALQKERQRVMEKLEQSDKEEIEQHQKTQSLFHKILHSKNTTKEKLWYNYIFPEADVKELIASSGPDYDNPHLLKLLKLTTGSFYFIVFLNSKNRLRCNEHGNIETLSHYDYEKDNETFAHIREAETFPTTIMPRKERHAFLVKLGLAHQMRYEGCYQQVGPMVDDALRFAAHRNMAATRFWTLSTATFGAVIAVILLAMIHYLVPTWDSTSAIVQTLASDGLYAGVMGVIGGYTSLWLRYRSLGEVTFGGRKTVVMMSACRLLIGAVFAYIAILAVRSGLLFPSLEGHVAAIGVISFVAGFSERLIPSFIKNFSHQTDNNEEENRN